MNCELQSANSSIIVLNVRIWFDWGSFETSQSSSRCCMLQIRNICCCKDVYCNTAIFAFFIFRSCDLPQVEERKQSYLNSYDIVLMKDETMDVPNAILLYLTGNKWTEEVVPFTGQLVLGNPVPHRGHVVCWGSPGPEGANRLIATN